MNAAEFQSQVIDKLDKVVVGAEALIMDENARTAADFQRLKSEIQALLDVITRYERLCYDESSLSSVKQTLAALKRSTETASWEGASAAEANAKAEGGETLSGEDDGLSFGFEVLDGDKASASADGSSSENAAVESAANVGVAASAEVAEAAVPDAAETAASAAKTKKVEPELGLMFDDEPEPPAAAPEAPMQVEAEAAVGTRPVASADPVSEPAVTLSESVLTAGLQALEAEESVPAETPTAQAEDAQAAHAAPTEFAPAAEAATQAATPEADPMAAFDTTPEPAATSVANELFEAIKQESMAQFSVREEDQPQSYITQLTAMAQAKVKGEQDMSGVAVSSTARPDDAKPTPSHSSSSGDSLMDSLRSIRANLHGGQLRTMVDKFKAPQTIYDIQSTRSVVDLKMTIGVNEKYLLTQELFGGNVKEYTEAVGRLNDAKDTEAATSVWQNLSRQRAWDEGSLAYATFYDLLKRRFPDMA